MSYITSAQIQDEINSVCTTEAAACSSAWVAELDRELAELPCWLELLIAEAGELDMEQEMTETVSD